MVFQHPQAYADIDWNLLWQTARKQRSWKEATASDWDKKARAFADRNTDSPYAALVLPRLPLDPSMTVLDIGAGPGTLSLPLAPRVASVTAMDYSSQMLAILQKRAEEKNISNIKTVACAWEDDWDACGIGIHDLAIASRSLAVNDLEGALHKLNDYTRKFVFITDRIAPTPFDPAAFKAIGRQFDSGPDYIYTLNVLYSMNIHPCLEVLQLERDLLFTDMDEAFSAYDWMFRDLTPLESQKLRGYLSSRIIRSEKNRLVLRREFPPRWAMIWWKKTTEESDI